MFSGKLHQFQGISRRNLCIEHPLKTCFFFFFFLFEKCIWSAWFLAYHLEPCVPSPLSCEWGERCWQRGWSRLHWPVGGLSLRRVLSQCTGCNFTVCLLLVYLFVWSAEAPVLYCTYFFTFTCMYICVSVQLWWYWTTSFDRQMSKRFVCTLLAL